METYDIYFRDEQDSANKGFNLKDKEKAIRREKRLCERLSGRNYFSYR